MQLSDFEKYLSDYLNASIFVDYCPNGLQVEGKGVIEKAATAVSATLETLEQAADEEIDALIVHHGLFWNRDPYPLTGAKLKKIKLLLEKGISLLAYHLPLDAHQEVGNNWKAARDLGWDQLEPFGILNGVHIGVKGSFSPKPVETFVTELETYYRHSAAKALGGEKIIRNAALISGGAYKELASAAKEGLDCYITGNFDEPAWGVAFEEKIHFFALGHTATEEVGPKALAEHIQNQLKIKCRFLDIHNPF